MEIQNDFKEFFECLNAHDVEYMIVGSYALAFHGSPRYTGDIDVYVKPDKINAERIVKALDDFGFSSLGLSPSDFQLPDKIIQLGVAPVRIDIMTSISGIDWETAARGCAHGFYSDLPVRYIGRNEFIQNKRACGRKKDAADLEVMGEE
jgi:hypothetical protein